MRPRKKDKKRRRTGSQLQGRNAEKVQRKKQEEKAFTLATEQWHIEVKKDKFNRKTASSIVEEINATGGTNINERTVRRYVNEGKVGVPCIGRGKKCIIPDVLMEALRCAVVSYIQLSNAGMVKMPDRKYVIQQVKVCVKKSGINFKRYDRLYDRIMESIADKISVNNSDFKIEQRRLLWTTYSNINIWFDTLKKSSLKRVSHETRQMKIEM